MTAMPPPLKPACPGCGNTNVEFDPVEQALYCPYCNSHGATIVAEQAGVDIGIDLESGLEALEKSLQQDNVQSIQCHGCGSRLAMGSDAATTACPFCGGKLPAERIQPLAAQRPGWIIPFGINRKLAQEKVANWLKSRWFAPQSFRKLASGDQKIAGVYLPYWAFTAQVHCRYTGERGTKKPEAQNKTTTDLSTDYNWRSCSGEIAPTFRDIVIPASERLPVNLQSWLNWKLDRLVAWDPRFLAGYQNEIAQVQLTRAHALARDQMEKQLVSEIHESIGGDTQRIFEKEAHWSAEKFRLFLAPVWVAHCQHQGQNKLVLVDGQNGEVVGERPYSKVKIIALIAAILYVLYRLFTN